MNGLRLPRSGASSSGPNNYMSTIPTTIPPGLCLVHNKVIIGITPRRKPGVQGFRAWLAPLDPVSLEVCACGWAPELPVHHRVHRMRVDKDAAAVDKNIVKTMRDRKQAAAAVTE